MAQHKKTIVLIFSVIFFCFSFFPLAVKAGACRCAMEKTSDCYSDATNQAACDKIIPATPAKNYKFCSYFSDLSNCQNWTTGGGTTASYASLNIKDTPAPTTEKLPFKPVVPTLEVDVPTLQPFSVNSIKPDSEGYIHIPFLGQYIAAIFRWALLVAGVIATLVIIFGGLIYLTSGGNAQRAKEGRERITQALLGLILLLASYAILYIINPDLVSFKSLKIQIISREELEIKQIVMAGTDDGGSSENITPKDSLCLKATDQSSLQGVVAIGGGATLNPNVHKDLVEPLKKADAILKAKGKVLLVVSAARDIKTQEELWQAALKQHGGDEKIAKTFTAPPSCSSPHVMGRAVDVCIKGSVSCDKRSHSLASYTDDDVKLLQQAMETAGWNRYCNEWWHFEYNCTACPKTNRSPSGCNP